MKQTENFTMEELQELEELNILGGGDSGTVVQNNCTNTVAGCAGCSVDDNCTNNVSGCACEEEDEKEDKCNGGKKNL